MPSAKHETPLALIRQSPDLLARILRDLFDVPVPDFRHGRPHVADVQILRPSTLHADAVVVFTSDDDQPVLTVIVEVQLRWDARKLRTWPIYLAHLENELDVAAALVVYCPSARVAARYQKQISSRGIGLKMQPLFLTPDDLPLITDLATGRHDPALTILSALAHSGSTHIREAFPALGAALATIGDDRSVSYYDIVAAGLPPEASEDWRIYMTSTVKHRFLSEHLRSLESEAVEKGLKKGIEQGREQGLADGRAQGEASAVIAVLEARGLDVPDAVRQQIVSTSDLELLHVWLRRAVTAGTADDVLVEEHEIN